MSGIIPAIGNGVVNKMEKKTLPLWNTTFDWGIGGEEDYK